MQSVLGAIMLRTKFMQVRFGPKKRSLVGMGIGKQIGAYI